MVRESFLLQFYQLSIHHKFRACKFLFRATGSWREKKFWVGVLRLMTPVFVYEKISRQRADRTLQNRSDILASKTCDRS